MKILKESNRIEIKRKKGRTILLCLASLLFTSLSLYVWFQILSQKRYPESSLEFILLIGLPFFIVGGWFSFKVLLDGKPAVIISPEGLSIYSNLITSDLIQWADIKRFEVHTVKRTRLIIIYIVNPENATRLSSGIKGIFMRMGNGFYGTPYSISAGVLDCSLNDLLAVLNDKLAKYNKNA